MDTSPFVERRARLAEAMGEQSVAVLHAAPVRPRSGDTEHSYRQDSDFYYLTGFDEPGAVCVISPGREPLYTLFVRPSHRQRETWEGRRVGVEAACGALGADDAFDIAELDAKLPELVGGAERILTSLAPETDHRLGTLLRGGRVARRRTGRGPHAVEDIGHLLHPMRVIKDESEIGTLRRAAQITAEAHLAALRACRTGILERELQAEIEYTFVRMGASGPAYGTTVASGGAATTLHYVENDGRIAAGDLVLVDAGAELSCYAADVTRTFPAGGRFDATQRAAYQVVLEAQQAAIECCRPGSTLAQVHGAALRRLVEGMIELDLLTGDADRIIEVGDHKRFFMHTTSHWLGLDVHDVGDYKVDGESRALEPGMVLTVEPGLYVRDDEEDVPQELRGTGIRIEDDLLITGQGAEVLSAGVPKEIDELESVLEG